MIEIFRNPNYNFIGQRRWAYAVSLVITVIALISLATHGLRYDIDFTGGTLVQVRFEQKPDIAKIRAALAKIEGPVLLACEVLSPSKASPPAAPATRLVWIRLSF